jgi:hypothetical protein
MTSRRLAVVTLVAAVGAAAGLGTPALTKTPDGTASQATQCRATFHVLHDDRIGRLQLPEGAYRLSPSGLTCAQASQLFTEFLKDWDGRLPRPWRISAEAVGQGTFQRGTGLASFDVERVGDVTPGSPGHTADGGGSHGVGSCGMFRVQHNDRIGRLRLPRGQYMVTTLGPRLSCSTAFNLFRRFLNRPRGNLPGGWVMLGQTGEFMQRSSFYGFRVDPAASTSASASLSRR